jgi:serine/threonine-protein kinase RsbW
MSVMEISFTLCLPRDEASVPVVRHLCRDALLKLGVSAECVSDIELAVTEACTNVLNHAAGTDEQYEVAVAIDDRHCEIRIVDTGKGFEHADVGHVTSAQMAESGRGVFLMRALVDELDFVSAPEQGTVVRLQKSLSLEPDSMLRVLSARERGSAGSLDDRAHDGQKTSAR